MKPYQRRAAQAYPYFKLAEWDAHSLTWRDGKRAHPTEDAARSQAGPSGRYRISRIDEAGRRDLEPFTV